METDTTLSYWRTPGFLCFVAHLIMVVINLGGHLIATYRPEVHPTTLSAMYSFALIVVQAFLFVMVRVHFGNFPGYR